MKDLAQRIYEVLRKHFLFVYLRFRLYFFIFISTNFHSMDARVFNQLFLCYYNIIVVMKKTFKIETHFISLRTIKPFIRRLNFHRSEPIGIQ